MTLLAFVAATVLAQAPGLDRTLTVEAVIDAPVAEVWEACTTKAGVESWMVPLAEVDFRVGGTIKTNYNKEAGIGGPGTIVHHILSYEPKRMIATRFEAPGDAPKAKLGEKTWVVMRMEPMGDERTRFTETMVGFGEGAEWDEVYEFFRKGNEWTVEQLRMKFQRPLLRIEGGLGGAADERKTVADVDSSLFVASGAELRRVVKEADIKASPADVFRTWTTGEGWKAFLGCGADINLRIGGKFEVRFSEEPPEGLRGSEGCQILSYVPDESVAFSWNAPPKFAKVRAERAWVQVSMRDNGLGGSRVRLGHTGFGDGEEWDAVYAYFDAAWGSVMDKLAAHFKSAKVSGPSWFLYHVKPVRAGFMELPTKEESAIVGEHFAYLKGLRDRGDLVIAGPCTDGFGGIAVYKASDEGAAKAMLENDPAVKKGVFAGEVHPFWMSLVR